MNQDTFLQRHEAEWQAIEATLAELSSTRPSPERLHHFTHDYRRLCQQLAVARHRRYGSDVVERLNGLVLQAHSHLYGGGVVGFGARIWAAVVAFPRAVRAQWRSVVIAHAVFYLPALGMMAAVTGWPELVQSAIGPAEVAQLEGMYDPSAEHFLRERPLDSDLLMFGYYIWNNIGIAFKTFAGGVLGGLGSLFYLLLNGVTLGASAGHLTAVGMGRTFWSFVVTHGAFELTAIVLSGAAGLRLGWAVLVPGNRSRSLALTTTAQEVMPIVWGFTALLVVAAFIEAFWSSSQVVPATVKFGVGATAWCWVYGYLLMAGKVQGEGSRGS